jgi:peptidyl-prolyl cis-trans isomerase C
MRLPDRFPTSLWGRLALAVLAPIVILCIIGLVVVEASRLPSDAAFEVSGTVVTKFAMAHRLQVLGALYGLRAPANDPGQLDKFQRDTAQSVALSTVIDREVEARHLTVPAPQAQALETDFINNGIKPGGQEAFVQLLRDTGASEGDVLDELKRQVGALTLYHQVTDRAAASLTEADVAAYYRQHSGEIVQPEQRHLRNIVVETQGEADQLVADIKGGADFAAVATQSSLDGKTRDAGGDLGFVAATQLAGGYDKAAFAAPPGALFGPVQTSDGWNIGQVLEVRPAVPLQYGQVHDQLMQQLRAERAVTAWQNWLVDQVSRADIRYADQYRPADPASAARTASPPVGALTATPGAEAPR